MLITNCGNSGAAKRGPTEASTSWPANLSGGQLRAGRFCSPQGDISQGAEGGTDPYNPPPRGPRVLTPRDNVSRYGLSRGWSSGVKDIFPRERRRGRAALKSHAGAVCSRRLWHAVFWIWGGVCVVPYDRELNISSVIVPFPLVCPENTFSFVHLSTKSKRVLLKYSPA